MAKIYINAADAKEELAELINRVAHHKEHIILTRRGKEVAALIPIEDLKTIEENQQKNYLKEAVDALKEANQIYFYRSDIVSWDVDKLFRSTQKSGGVFNKIPSLLSDLVGKVKENDRVIFMSNGGFDNIQDEFIKLI